MKFPDRDALLHWAAGSVLALAGWAASSQISRIEKVETIQAGQTPAISALGANVDAVKNDVREIREDLREIKKLLSDRK